MEVSVFIMVLVFANSIFFKNGSVGAVNNNFFCHVKLTHNIIELV